jgi:hypothetical protein
MIRWRFVDNTNLLFCIMNTSIYPQLVYFVKGIKTIVK